MLLQEMDSLVLGKGGGRGGWWARGLVGDGLPEYLEHHTPPLIIPADSGRLPHSAHAISLPVEEHRVPTS